MPRLIRGALPLCIFLCASTVFAQTLETGRASGTGLGGGTRTVSGQVVLQGVNTGPIRVSVESASRSINRTFFTDSSGSFSLSLGAGSYYFTFEAEGYRPLREQVDVPPGNGMHIVQFMMRPMPASSSGSKDASVSVATLNIPDGARKEFEAGQHAVEQKMWKEARQHFEAALAKHAKFPHAHRALAVLDMAEQNSEKALEHLRHAVEIDTSYADGQNLLSHVLNSMGRHAEAFEAAQKAISLRSDVWQSHYELGFAALALGQEDLALECSKRIESLGGPKVPEIRLLKAGVSLRKRDYQDARTELLAFLQLAPNHAYAALAKQTLADVEGRLPLAPR